MADISMCSNDKCLKRKSCYRYTAVPNPFYQAYADFSDEDKPCGYYWDNTNKRNVNSENIL